jgi:hypothetical protein
MAVHEDGHPSVKLLAAQPLGLKHDGRFGQHRRREL